jgi:hypothetical protein
VTPARLTKSLSRTGFAGEDHLYINTYNPKQILIAAWKIAFVSRATQYTVDFGKPLHLCEYGPFPTNFTGWNDRSSKLSLHIQDKIAGQGWHEWEH